MDDLGLLMTMIGIDWKEIFCLRRYTIYVSCRAYCSCQVWQAVFLLSLLCIAFTVVPAFDLVPCAKIRGDYIGVKVARSSTVSMGICVRLNIVNSTTMC